MHGILHSLQIGTLSTWLSLATFGAVGIYVNPWQTPAPAPLPISEETEIIPNDFLLEAPIGADGDTSATSTENAPPLLPDTPELLSAPPGLAPLAELPPLPEIPDLPPPPTPTATPQPPSTSARASASPSSRSTSTPRNSSGSSSNNSSSTGTASGSGSGGQSPASRLAAGRMPAPSYPTSARRAGQTGSVLVEFTIGTHGRVISAYAKSPSPYPALNEAAVRAVRRWKFPPGSILKTQRRLDFVLNR